MASPTLLLLDDDPGVRSLLTQLAGRAGFEVATFGDPAGALSAVRHAAPDVAFVDLRLPRMGGLSVLQEIKRSAPHCEVLLMSGYATVETAVEALKLGAQDCLCKPFDIPALRAKLERLRHTIGQRSAWTPSPAEAPATGLVCESASMQSLHDLLERVAPHFTTALVTGEAGVGKERVARALQQLGRRRERPFVVLDAAGAVDLRFESEWFGHTVGAFPGAVDPNVGAFERAHGGTVFIEEVGDLPPGMQAKLLRVLEAGEVMRLGGREPLHVNVHVIAATSRCLERDVEEGRFRGDLLYRLNTVELPVPPLRDRTDDIPALAQTFVRECAARLGKTIDGLAPDAEQMLLEYQWPGNVRELRNAIERACMLAAGARIEAEDLRLHPAPAQAGTPREATRVRRILDLEREAIERALNETRGNKQEAARRLGISRRALYRRLEKYGIAL